jgi:signal transduction histidine kinase
MTSNPQTPPGHPIRANPRLFEALQHFSEAANTRASLQLVADSARTLTDSQGSTLFVHERETGLLRGLTTSPISQAEVFSRLRVPFENSIAGQCYHDGIPLIVNDARNDPRVYRGADRALGVLTSSIAVVPLNVHGRVLGVLEVINKRPGSYYTEEDVSILETLGIHAAQRLELSNLEEELGHQRSILDEHERRKTEFIAIASHELRTPIGIILGHASLLIDSGSDRVYREQYDAIYAAAHRLKDIIENLSSLDSTEHSGPGLNSSPVDINALIRDVTVSLHPLSEQQKVDLQLNLSTEPIIIPGDRDKLFIAISELVRNGLIFTDPGGEVRLSTEQVAGFASIYIIDTGIGIPANDLGRIFERFYQVESHLIRRHGGMGMGLAVARTIIELHSGHIWAESRLGVGSSFNVLIPIRPANKPALIP